MATDPWLQRYNPRERPALDTFLKGTHSASSPIRLLPVCSIFEALVTHFQKEILQYIFSFFARGRRRGQYQPTSKGVLLKMLILGESMVGKTSILHQYVNKRFSSHYKATIGADFLTAERNFLGQNCVLQIWDTAGSERFALQKFMKLRVTGPPRLHEDPSRFPFFCFVQTLTSPRRFAPLHPAFYRGTDGVMVVFDVTSRSSFQEVDTWLQGFRASCPETEAVVVCGNKSDLIEQGKAQVSSQVPDSNQPSSASTKTGSPSPNCFS